MDQSSQRYDVLCDPMDMWMVWDNVAEEPASFGGQILYGLVESHALEVAKIMNELYGKGGTREEPVASDAFDARPRLSADGRRS